MELKSPRKSNKLSWISEDFLLFVLGTLSFCSYAKFSLFFWNKLHWSLLKLNGFGKSLESGNNFNIIVCKHFEIGTLSTLVRIQRRNVAWHYMYWPGCWRHDGVLLLLVKRKARKRAVLCPWHFSRPRRRRLLSHSILPLHNSACGASDTRTSWWWPVTWKS